MVICTLLIAMALCLASCNEVKKPASSTEKGPVNLSKSLDSGQRGIRIRVHSQGDKFLLFKLENQTGKPIYVAYQPSAEPGRAISLSNFLERKMQGGGEFKVIEPIPHFAPSLHAIYSGDSILFAPFFVPEKTGEYRVHVRYIDDEEAYQHILKKMPFDWTEEEKTKVEKSWKPLYSEVFSISK